MDNFAMRVVGAWSRNGDDDLTLALDIAFNHHSRCVAWAVKGGALFLYWTPIAGATKTLTPLNARESHAMVTAWLDEADLPAEIPESDANEEDGAFEAWTNEWGHGGGESGALLAIKPRTRWLGK